MALALPDVDQVVFVALGALILASAWQVLRSQEVMHAVVWLSVVLLGVAGIYLTLGAEILAWVQVLIYVGAVVTLILFTIMLTTPAVDIAKPMPVEEEL
jgi:NADH:ubiquinone oxidoreductase subunit 6 (subunit J)